MSEGTQTNLFDRSARVGFLVLIVLLPIVRPLSFYVGSLRVSLSDLVFPLVALLWLLSKFVAKERPAIGAFHGFVGLYAAALTLSAIFSVEPERSFLKLAGEFYLFALAIVAFDLVRTEGFVKHVASAWLIGTGVTVIATLAGFGMFYLGYKTQADNYFLSHVGSLPAGDYPRILALFANANMMCNFLNVSLIFSLLAGELGWIRKRLSWILTAGIWFAAIFTFSIGLGGMLLSSGIWFGAKYAYRNRPMKSRAFASAGVLAAILFLVAACVSPDTPNTEQQISVPGIATVEPSVRVLVWQVTMSTIAAYPIVGKGVGTDPVSLFYTTLSGQNQILADAHNMYLSVFAQAGIIGIGAFGSLLWFLARRFRYRFGDESVTTITALSCALIGAFLYQGLTGSFEDARHLWILIGMFAGIAVQSTVRDLRLATNL